ncbi:FkbM family methyltransferase [Vibrio crassostreae]|uniref:FkbM family methyltransferase n=1 Tax=Vibrio crassostreae TaxID=246167 RepID=UPI001B302E88|nr:FkbM family methyltransferase [Vibrio crassostreae]
MNNITTLHEHGVEYKISLPNKDLDYIQKKIAESNRPYEYKMLEDMYSRLSIGDCVLDIGANVGNHTLYLAAVAQCHVEAFEPNKLLCDAISLSCKENGFQDRVKVHNFALSSAPGEATFVATDESNLGSQSIELSQESASEECFEVKVIDQLEFSLPIKLMKVDVEGFELEVLKGAKELIQRDMPYIYVECLTEDEFATVSELLTDYGYSYWDTFNASPTHLFIPDRDISLDKKLNHVINKNLKDLYRSRHEVVELRKKLSNCNDKYRAVTKSSNKVKTELAVLKERHESVKFDENRLIEEKNQTQALEKELLRLNEVVAQLNRESGNILEIQAKLDAANEKYSLACQRIDDLKESLLNKDTVIAAKEERLLVLNDQAVTEASQKDLLKAQLDSANLDAIEQLKKEAEINCKLVQLLEGDARHKLKASKLETDICQFKQELNDASNAQKQSEVKLSETTKKLEQTELELSEANEKVVQTELELSEANEKVVQTELELSETTEKFKQLKLSFNQFQDSSKNSLQKLEEVKESLDIEIKKLLDEVSLLTQSLDKRTAQFDTLAEEFEYFREESRKTESEFSIVIDSANEKYRQATSEQIPALKDKWNSELELRRKVQLELEQAKTQLKAANAENVLAKKRVLAIRNSNTFKVGYLFKKHMKSPIGWAKFPVGLWRLYKQSKVKKAAPTINQQSTLILDIPIINANNKKAFEPIVLNDNSGSDVLSLDRATKNSALKVACIMDEFTYQSYLPECNLKQLTPTHWLKELEDFKPEMLFIESAWRGKDELWGSKVGHLSDEVKSIINWCNENDVPTAFWNKEDPIHFETFLNTAKLFDHVFTTDIDCVQRYKSALKHEHVYFLPFACQPLTNNPIEKYKRKNGVSFAGAYYVKYPERTKDLESFVQELPKFKQLEIYDRNFGKNDVNYQFPEVYSPFIVGTLPFEEIDKAYKGYDYAINLNSIKQSQTMFARRVYELLASNTITISNFSQGVRLLFGDLIVTTDNGKEAVERLKSWESQTHGIERLKLAGLRKVISEHTYQDRLNYIQQKVFNAPHKSPLPKVGVVSKVKSKEQFESVIKSVGSQHRVDLELLVVVSNQRLKSKLDKLAKSSDINCTVKVNKAVSNMMLSNLFDSPCWVTYMASDDYFGKNYLQDLLLATRYSCAKAIGKAATFEWDKGKLIEPTELTSYQIANQLSARCSILSASHQAELKVKDWLEAVNSGEGYKFEDQLAIDPYNYCINNTKKLLTLVEEQSISETVSDLEVNTGLSMALLSEQAEGIEAVTDQVSEVVEMKGEAFVEKLDVKPTKQVKLGVTQGGLNVRSDLADGKHDYLYANQDIARSELSSVEVDSIIPLNFDIEPGLNISIVLLYLDQAKQRIGHSILQANRNHTVELPYETEYIRFGLRILSSGEAKVKSLMFAHKDLQPEKIFGQSDILILTNNYPSYDDLYRNGFVHSRAKAYQSQGIGADVFRLRQGEPVSWHEYQDISVTTGAQSALRKMLQSGQYKHILVHFLDSHMWEVLSDFVDEIKVTIWIHGSEVQPWHRRKVIYDTPDKIELGKAQFAEKKLLWGEVFTRRTDNLDFVFVSNYLMQTTVEDYGLDLDKLKYHIIPNPINTELFKYQEKCPTQRYKILSIRPYASKIYANDLAVAAVLELSNKEYFKDLQFHFIGDGPLFDEVLEPIKSFENVKIERKFLSQNEIADLHKDYGVFLCPSRMDTQGVSRDEAMASGLVPITTNVAAIPEFVSDEQGYLANVDKSSELTNFIDALVGSENEFKVRSASSVNCILQNRSQEKVTFLELELLGNE